jgi:glucose/arabinose dehydrogenase
MLPVAIRVTGIILLLASLVFAQLLRFLPSSSPLLWLFPAGLFISGGILFFCCRQRRKLIALLTLVGLVAILVRLPPWPSLSSGASESEVGKTLLLQPVALQVPDMFRQGGLSEPHKLFVPEGLQISVFAANLRKPRMLAFSPAGDLYVSLPGTGEIAVLPDSDHNGISDGMDIFASGLDRPHGLAFSGKDLLVAENGRLIKLVDQNADRRADSLEIISSDLPAGGGHWTRSVLVGADGAYYVSAGSSCNSCIESDPRRAAILRIAKTGGEAKVYARGLRNSVGLARHPQTGDIWASNNGRDMLGDDLPPEELNRIVADGEYGWPYCYGQRIPDPDLGRPELCRNTIPPMVEMPAHSAPLGITFGAGLDFPPPLQQMLFVAFHGSWNRRTPTGYKLIGIPFENGIPRGEPQDIVTGWLEKATAWGRPVAPAVGPDGALYLSDDRAGVIYRISRR